MKAKVIFFFLLTIALLSACELSINDSIIESEKDQPILMSINFEDVDTETKALDVTTANMSSFTAYANYAGTSNSFFSGTTFTSDGTVFRSSPAITWKGKLLDFYTYSTGSASGQVNAVDYSSFVVTPVSNPTNQVDFVFACAKGQSSNNATNGVIPLTFKHAQSKVSVKVKNTSSYFKFTVYAWRLGYFDGSATFTYNGVTTSSSNNLPVSCWSDNTSPSAINIYTMDISSSPVAVAKSTSSAISLSGEAVTIPQNVSAATGYASAKGPVNGGYIAFKVKIQDASTNEVLYGGSNGGWAIWPTAFSWEPGKNYSYTVDLRGCGYYEESPSSTAFVSVLTDFPTYTFGGLMLTRGPLYYTGASYVVNNSWDLTSYNSTYGVNAGSTYFSFIQMGQLFKSASFSNSSGNITNTLDPLDGWRLPTQDEWTTILGTSRAGSTIDGGSTKRHYAYIRLTGVTYCGDSTPEGLLLFPDNKAITGVSLSYLDNTTVNTGVTVSKLNSLIEQGCVFLPMGGYSNDGTWSRGGERGYFWSTIQNNSSTAKYAYIVTGTAPGIGSSSWNKSSYHSLVYLVRTPD